MYPSEVLIASTPMGSIVSVERNLELDTPAFADEICGSVEDASALIELADTEAGIGFVVNLINRLDA